MLDEARMEGEKSIKSDVKDRYFIAVPIILLLISLGLISWGLFFGFSLRDYEDAKRLYWSIIKIVLIFTAISIPVVLVLNFGYLQMIIILRNKLLTLTWAVPLSVGILLTVGLYLAFKDAEDVFAIVGGVFGGYFGSTGVMLAILFLCFRSRLNMTNYLLKTSINDLIRQSFKCFLNVSMFCVLSITFFIIVLVSIFGFTISLRDDIQTNKGDDKVTSIVGSIISVILIIGLYFSCYIAKMLGFAFGASYSVSYLEKKPEENTYCSKALSQVFRYKLGTICLAAIIEAIVAFVQDQSDKKSQKSNDILIAVMNCIIQMIGDFIIYVCDIAVVYSILYNTNFYKGAKMGFEMFNKNGLKKITGYIIINFLLGTVAMGFQTFAVCISILIGHLFHDKFLSMTNNRLDKLIEIYIICGLELFFGMFFSFLTLNGMFAGMANAHLVYYLENPAAFEAKDPYYFDKIRKCIEEEKPKLSL